MYIYFQNDIQLVRFCWHQRRHPRCNIGSAVTDNGKQPWWNPLLEPYKGILKIAFTANQCPNLCTIHISFQFVHKTSATTANCEQTDCPQQVFEKIDMQTINIQHQNYPTHIHTYLPRSMWIDSYFKYIYIYILAMKIQLYTFWKTNINIYKTCTNMITRHQSS